MNNLLGLGLSVTASVIAIEINLIQPTSIAAIEHQRLSETEITQQLRTLSQWQRQDQTLVYTHRFKTFIEAVNFINCLIEPAETLGHHPDLQISYNQVTFSLTTHDAGGLTHLDFQLAQQVNLILSDWTHETTCTHSR